MQPTQDPRRDDFDMARLQKSLKQQRHWPARQRDSITKLSPSEIRSLNISTATSKSMDGTSSSRQQRANTVTPPRTPEHPSAPQNLISDRTDMNLPTPPHSPNDAASKRQSSATGNGTHVHSPIPRSHSKTGLVLSTPTSRPQSASSHRGMPTYRGPELTKTGSVSMLRSAAPATQIVDNPLSQFSRPRLPRGSVSPTRQDDKLPQTDHEDTHPIRTPSQSVVAAPSERPDTSPSFARQPGLLTNGVPTTAAAETETDEPLESITSNAQTVAVDGPIPIEPHSRFSWGWRKNSGVRSKNRNESTETTRTKSKSNLWGRSSRPSVQSVAYEQIAPRKAPENRVSLKGDLPSSRAFSPDELKTPLPPSVTDFIAHPAVRPLNDQHEHPIDVKGKGRAREDEDEGVHHDLFSDDTIPMYSRCPCCDRLKKPDGSRALSPILDNENLRTNISMEMERTDNLALEQRRSSSAGQPKYTPIIPMVVASGNTVQAKIAPKAVGAPPLPREAPPSMPIINLRGDLIASGGEPRSHNPEKAEEKGRKVVRFSSLHHKDGSRKQANVGTMAFTKLSGPQETGIANGIPPAQPDGDTIPQITFIDRSWQATGDPPRTEPLRFTQEDDVPTGISDEITNELMAAINGVKIGTDNDDFEFQNQKEMQILDEANTIRLTPPLNELNVSDPIPGLALTTDDAVPQVLSVQTSDEPAPVSRIVSFEPIALEPERTATPPAPKTASRKSALKRRQEPQPTPASHYATYYSDPSKGITTKPKATAQFMFRSDSHELSPNMLPRDYTAANSGYRGPTYRNTSQRGSFMTPSTRSSIASSSGTSSRSSRPQSYVERGTGSYEALPSPRLGGSPAGSTTSVDKVGMPERKRSGLVESVLAATGGRRGGANPMNKAKQ